MLTINLVEANNYTQRRTKLDKVLALIQNVINGDDFKKMVFDFKTEDKKTFYFRKNLLRKQIETVYSNKEVYKMIMAGVEEPGNVSLGSMDLYLTLLNGSDGSTIGYGNPGTKEIFTYSTMFDAMTIPELANHYVHEWCHKLGFEHSFARNRMRNYSVPYAVGNIIEELVEKLMPQQMQMAVATGVLTATIKIEFFQGNLSDHLNATLKIKGGGSNFGMVNSDGGSIIFNNVSPGDKIILDGLAIGDAKLGITGVTLDLVPKTNYHQGHIIGLFVIQ